MDEILQLREYIEAQRYQDALLIDWRNGRNSKRGQNQ